ncbi:MAG: sulfurtransferase [Aldersonia sp.]|nr:sulfurtransferase [Aldersonia sp.]
MSTTLQTRARSAKAPKTIDGMLDEARAQLERIYAFEVPAAIERGAILVDIRPQAQRAREGTLPGALAIERNVLEWRCDPASSARIALAVDHDVEWIIVCSEGYTSSLAAAALQQLGLHKATDLVGGYQALVAAGLVGAAARAGHFVRDAQMLTSI